MGGDPSREPPFFFTKFTDSVVDAKDPVSIPYPSETTNFHYECELVVVLCARGYQIPVERAAEYIYGYGVGIDFTRRDMQNEAKEMRRPWDMSKSFDFAGPVSAIVPKEAVSELSSRRMDLQVNGVPRQTTSLRLMIWSVPEMLARLSRYCVLEPGDVLFCGTPAGVGAVNIGDVLTATVEGLPSCVCTIAPAMEPK